MDVWTSAAELQTLNFSTWTDSEANTKVDEVPVHANVQQVPWVTAARFDWRDALIIKRFDSKPFEMISRLQVEFRIWSEVVTAQCWRWAEITHASIATVVELLLTIKFRKMMKNVWRTNPSDLLRMFSWMFGRMYSRTCDDVHRILHLSAWKMPSLMLSEHHNLTSTKVDEDDHLHSTFGLQ